jgi:MoxR-like ATPase
MPFLISNKGSFSGATHALVPPAFSLGRDPGNALILPNQSGASRKHALLFEKDGVWWVEDLGSSNGTSVNGREIAQPVRLAEGDLIAVGVKELRFSLVLPPDAPKPAAPEAHARGADSASASDSAGKAASAPALPVLSSPPPAAPVPAKTPEKPSEFSTEVQDLVNRMSALTGEIRKEIGKAIVGQVDIVMDMLTAIISRGHVLLIGMPGLAKTTLVRTISEVLDLEFRRIQFTPDLMPSDITGTDILEVDDETGKKAYRFIKGPIFTQILLADEINRTPPKTQAALLEAMQEYRVTASGETFDLSAPFFVLATQNPLEQEGTYPLPEAQLDRFMFSTYIDYPTEEEEMIAKFTTSTVKTVLEKVMDGAQILELQKTVRDLPVSDHVLKYAVRLVRATRPGDKRAPDFITRWIQCASGPRAAQNIIVAAKARAVIAGRLLVTTSDVRSVARPVLRHRIFTNFIADSEGVDTDKIVEKLLEVVPEPDASDY